MIYTIIKRYNHPKKKQKKKQKKKKNWNENKIIKIDLNVVLKCVDGGN